MTGYKTLPPGFHKIVVRRLPPEEGGGYLACIPPWEETFNGWGETPQEAGEALRECVNLLKKLEKEEA